MDLAGAMRAANVVIALNGDENPSLAIEKARLIAASRGTAFSHAVAPMVAATIPLRSRPYVRRVAHGLFAEPSGSPAAGGAAESDR